MSYLVTAIGSLSAESVITSLRSRSDARVVGCNLHRREWTAAARLVDTFHQVPSAYEDGPFLHRMLEICAREKVLYLIALTDVEVDVLSIHRDAFAACGTTLCIPNRAAVQACRDKLSLHRSFERHPQVATIPTWDMANLPAGLPAFPLLAKPRNGRSSEGLKRIDDARDLDYVRNKVSGRDYILQPCLEGEVSVSDVVRDRARNRSVAVTRTERTRTINGAGLTVEMQPAGSLSALAQRIAEHLDVTGCINIEFLVHNGKPLLMDVNPRFSAGIAFSKLAGYDMVENHLRCFEGAVIDAGIDPATATYSRYYAETVTVPATGPTLKD